MKKDGKIFRCRDAGGPQPVDRGDLLARGMTNQRLGKRGGIIMRCRATIQQPVVALPEIQNSYE